jgi:hypothetical protein
MTKNLVARSARHDAQGFCRDMDVIEETTEYCESS